MKVITTHIGRMDIRVPKGKGFGQSTISQVRPEFILLEMGGMELDQPQMLKKIWRGPSHLTNRNRYRLEKVLLVYT